VAYGSRFQARYSDADNGTKMFDIDISFLYSSGRWVFHFKLLTALS